MIPQNYIIQGLVRQGAVMELVGIPVCQTHLANFPGAENIAPSIDACQVCERIAELEWEAYRIKNEAAMSTMVRDSIKVCYIAGPMTGYPDFNKPAFHKMKRLLNHYQIKALSPAEHPESMPYAWYMRKDLQMLLMADAAIFLAGWEDSRGALLEHKVARVTNRYIKYEKA